MARQAGRGAGRKTGARDQAPGASGAPGWPLALALFALAAAVRLVVVAQLHGHPLLQPVGSLDSGVAVDLARRIAGGDVLLRAGTEGQPFFFAPLYVYFLGAGLALGASLLAIQVVQALLGASAVVLLWRAARPWFGDAAAVAGAALLALTGPVVFHEAILLQSALDPFLTALALLAVTRAVTRGAAGARWRAWLVAGGAIGLLALNRPNALAWGLALAAILPLLGLRDETGGRAWRSAAIDGAAVLAGLALAVAPATARNLAVSGEPVAISSHGGLNFYIGNNAAADGTYHAVPGITPDLRGQARDARLVAERDEGRPLGARGTDAHFRRLAWRWIGGHPLDAAALFARKLACTFGATELALNYSYAYYAGDEPTLLRFLLVGAWLLVPLGVVGIVARAPRVPRAYLAWAVVVPAYALSVAAFFVSSRYRLPLFVPLAAGAGYALTELVALARSGGRRRLAVLASAIAAVALLALWPHPLDDGRSEERTAMLLWLADNGQADEALRRLPAVEAGHPEPALLLYRLGVALAENGRATDAVPLLERAAKAGRPEVALALGQALLDAGRARDAVPQLRAAWQAGTRADVAGFDLARALVASGRGEEAAVVLQELAARHPPTDASSALATATVALEAQRPELALRFADAGLALQKDVPALLEKRGLALAMLDRAAEAEAPLRRAAELDARSATVRLNLAVVEAQLGRIESARGLAREALALDPGYAQARGLLAELERVR